MCMKRISRFISISVLVLLLSGLAAVPASALTMGLRCIMGARHILLLCNGPEKHAILKQAIGGPVRPEVPASILQLHPNVDVLFF